jgi:hypothetical protein
MVSTRGRRTDRSGIINTLANHPCVKQHRLILFHVLKLLAIKLLPFTRG